MKDKQGKSWRVRVGLSYPTAPSVLKRLAAGEDVPREQRNEKRAEPGEVVNDLPAHSIPWLVEQGMIEPAEEVADGEAG